MGQVSHLTQLGVPPCRGHSPAWSPVKRELCLDDDLGHVYRRRNPKRGRHLTSQVVFWQTQRKCPRFNFKVTQTSGPGEFPHYSRRR